MTRAAAGTGERIVRMRVTMLRPPAGVQFCLQRGKQELLGALISTGADVAFDFEVRALPQSGGAVRLLGAFVQGPPAARFVYICVGTLAGQPLSPWTRRIKVPLTGITWEIIEAAGSGRLEAAFEGTRNDGTPACATVKLTRGWTPAKPAP